MEGNMKTWVFRLALICFFIGVASARVRAQDGAVLYKSWCASCHEAGGASRAPAGSVLKEMTPEQILIALESGVMSTQGAERSRPERRALAEYLSGKPFGSEMVSPILKSAFCANPASSFESGPAWNGWGVTVNNTRFQPAAAAGISGADVSRLKLKWAFGFPGAVHMGSQPVVWGGRVFVGSTAGDVYSIDAKTGCIYWTMEVGAGVWDTISIGQAKDNAATAYFGAGTTVYAVNAATGKLVWKQKIEDFPLARITGSPTLYNGRLYVPMGSREETQAADLKYECCKFRGSVTALDAATGKQLWKTYMIPEEPRPTQKSRIGTQLWGPSGVGVWSAPTIDVKTKTIYVGTGNSYSYPEPKTSDAIVALDLDTGKIKWTHQFTPDDVSNSSCRKASEPAVCSAEAPDVDFSSSAMLVERKGKRLLIAGNKGAMVYALDLDHDGKLVWQQRVGKGGSSGGIMWGTAADTENVYAALADVEHQDGKLIQNSGGGLVAVSIESGQKVWTTPAPPCGEKKICSQAQSAAITAIPGVVFSGSVDGHLRGYSTADGEIIWDYDTAHDYATVDGVKAKGGSLNNGGPVVAGGMLFTNSGYARANGIMAGNVLLAFDVE
jgi:polyvinyl alcohol dehydrogenase (cytochrome)